MKITFVKIEFIIDVHANFALEWQLSIEVDI